MCIFLQLQAVFFYLIMHPSVFIRYETLDCPKTVVFSEGFSFGERLVNDDCLFVDERSAQLRKGMKNHGSYFMHKPSDNVSARFPIAQAPVTKLK